MSAELSTIETAEATAKPILEFGRAWMMDPATAATASELGLVEVGRFGFWANGRAGVLGEVDASVAAAAIGFMAPAAVARYWSARREGLGAWDCALAWFGCAASWGSTTMASMPTDQVQRLNELARAIIDSADPSFGALFAGSALIPMTGDPGADATINLNVLRELRGGAHLSAAHAAGLGPHGTIMSTDDPVRGGVAWSEGFGWTAPHPEPDHDARARVEEMTTVAAARAFEPLSPAERGEFAALVSAARATLG